MPYEIKKQKTGYKTGGNYPEGFKKYSFIIRPKIGGGYDKCEDGWKTYAFTCQKDLECSFDANKIARLQNPFTCNDGPKTKPRPTNNRNDVEDWWWNFKKDLEKIFNTRCHEAGDGTTYCSERDGSMADIPGEAYDILVPPEWKNLVDDLGKTIKGSETVLVNWLRDHKLGIFVDEWNKYIYEPLRDTIFNESWWTNVYRNMSLGDLLLLTLSVVLPFGDVPGIVLWAAIDTIKAVTEGGTGLQQMGDFFIALAKLPFPFGTISKTVFNTVENAIESGFKQMTEINAKDMFEDMYDQINKMMVRFPKVRGDTTIPKPSKMLDLAGKIDHVKGLVDKLNDKYNGYKTNIIPSPEAYSQAIKPLAEELMNSSRIFKDETYRITVDLGKLKDPILNQTIINGYNQYRKENKAPVDNSDDFREGEGKKGRGKKGKKKGKGDEIDTDEEEDEDLKKRMISLDLDEEDEEDEEDENKYDIVTMKMKNTAYKAYEDFFKKYLKNNDLKLTRRKFFDYYTIIKYKSLKEDFTLNISQLILILHKKLFLKYIENADDEDVDDEDYISEGITKFIDEVIKDLKKEGWSEDDDEDEEDEFTQQYKISLINRDGTPELFVNDDAFNEKESKDVMNAYEYFKSEIEKQISNGDIKSPNIKGFIIDKKKSSGHSDSLISSIVRGAIYIVDKLPPDLGERWCYSKSGSDGGYSFNLDATNDRYESFGIVLRLIDDEIQFCSMACIEQYSSENLYIAYLCSWKYSFRLFDEIKRLFQSKSETCGKLNGVSLSSVSDCDTVNFYANQGMIITEGKLKQIKEYALVYLKKMIETEDKQKITDLKNSFSGNKPDKLCNIKNIEDVFYACQAGGSKYLFREGIRDRYTSFDLFYLMKDEILPNLEELLKEFKEDDEEEEEEEEEEKEDFYYFPDDEKEIKKYFKQYEKFVNEHSELGIGSYPYDFFKEQFRIIKNMLKLENIDYDITVILKIIHYGDIKESVLPDSKIKITQRNIDDIIDKIDLWNNNQLNFIELSKAQIKERKETDEFLKKLDSMPEGSGIKGKKFFEELKKYGIDPDDYLIGVKANAKKNKYDPKLIDWAYDDVHKLKYFSPEGVKKFGRVGYKDNFIYKHLEKKKEVEKGTAKKMRDRFHKSHEAMTKKYDLSVYSPNELSLNILW